MASAVSWSGTVAIPTKRRGWRETMAATFSFCIRAKAWAARASAQ